MPTQRLGPVADVSSSNWSAGLGGPLYLAIQASGGDKITSTTASFVEPEYTMRLAAGHTPISGTCTLSVRCQRGPGGQNQDLFAEVTTQAGATIASATFSTLGTTWEVRTLTFAASAVADWTTGLRVLVKRLATVSGQYAEVDEVYLDTPPWGVPHLDIGTDGYIVAPAASGHYLVLDSPGFKRINGIEVAGALILDGGGGFKTWDGT